MNTYAFYVNLWSIIKTYDYYTHPVVKEYIVYIGTRQTLFEKHTSITYTLSYTYIKNKLFVLSTSYYFTRCII